MQDPFRTIHYEVSEDAAPEGAPADAGEGAEPAAEAEPWTPPTQAEWEIMQEQAKRLEFYENGGYPQQQEQGEEYEAPEEIDIVDLISDPEAFRAYVTDIVGNVQMTAAQSQEAEERAWDMLADVKAKEGDFLNPSDAKDLRVLQLADQMFPEVAQRYGVGLRSIEIAIANAYKSVREEEVADGKAYHERQVNQVQTLASARREPGASGQGAEGAAAATGGEGRTMAKYFGGGSGA